MKTAVSRAILDTLQTASNKLDNLPNNQGWKNDLAALARRLSKRDQTVAVFGAFSAGKSSLLNALFGQNILAVSPNPTTAAITHLTHETEAGSSKIIVTTKSVAEMWEDVRQAYGRLHVTVTTFEEAMKMAERIEPKDFLLQQRQTVSFLKAAAKGYPTMQSQFGISLEVSEEELKRFTAEESIACYVQSVRVGVPHPLTETITFVDTPGVDSVHRRHTQTAFEYMKQADAILFVLYYSHAFSRADKEFLLQLSGVQNIAGSNKLFVVINAVDLAKSDEERDAVRERVMQELRRAGIQQPHIYEVSSQLALAASSLENPMFEKLARLRLQLKDNEALPDAGAIYEKSGVDDLISDLRAYLENSRAELVRDATGRVWKSIEAGVQQGLLGAEEMLRADETERELRLGHRKNLEEDIRRQQVDLRTGCSPLEARLRAEWTELLFHVGERIRYRYPGIFREAYYPGQFRVDPKRGLIFAREELSHSLERQVDIELNTFALRVEHGLESALEDLRENLSALGRPFGITGLNVAREKPSSVSASFTPVSHIGMDIVEREEKSFKGTKDFFENGGQQKMLESLEKPLLVSVRDEVARLGQQVVDSALAAMLWETDLMFESLLDQLERMEEAASTQVRDAYREVLNYFTDVSSEIVEQAVAYAADVS